MKVLHKTLLFSSIVFALVSCKSTKKLSTGNSNTKELTLIDGYLSMEYRYMQFKTDKGDSVYSRTFDTCLTPQGYQELWGADGPPERIKPEFLHKKFMVTYLPDSIPNPNNMGQTIYGLNITKMELIK